MQYDVFISYTRDDSVTADRIARSLEQYRLPRKRRLLVFRDRTELGTQPQSIGATIEAALESSRVVLVLLSRSSAQSTWVKREIAAALNLRKAVVPVLLDSEARNNWVWPLLADQIPIEIDPQSRHDLERVVLGTVSILLDEPLSVTVERERRRTERRRTLLLAIAALLIGGLVGAAIAVSWLR